MWPELSTTPEKPNSYHKSWTLRGRGFLIDVPHSNLIDSGAVTSCANLAIHTDYSSEMYTESRTVTIQLKQTYCDSETSVCVSVFRLWSLRGTLFLRFMTCIVSTTHVHNHTLVARSHHLASISKQSGLILSSLSFLRTCAPCGGHIPFRSNHILTRAGALVCTPTRPGVLIRARATTSTVACATWWLIFIWYPASTAK